MLEKFRVFSHSIHHTTCMFRLLNAPRFASFQGPIIGGIAHPFLIFPFLVGNLEDTKSSNLGHLDRATSGQSCSVFKRMYKKNHIFNGANQKRLQDVQDSPALKNSTGFVPILGQERDCQRNGTSHKWIHLSNRPAQVGKRGSSQRTKATPVSSPKGSGSRSCGTELP